MHPANKVSFGPQDHLIRVICLIFWRLHARPSITDVLISGILSILTEMHSKRDFRRDVILKHLNLMSISIDRNFG